MSDPQLETVTDSNPRVVSPDDEPHLSQSSPTSSTPGAPRHRPPKLRRCQPQTTGEPELPPDTAAQLAANPAESSLAVQQPEWRHSSVHDADDEHEHSNYVYPSSEPAASKDTSSFGAGPAPALWTHPQAPNSRQRLVLDQSDGAAGGQSQRLTRIKDSEDASGDMARNIHGKAVRTVGGVTDGVVGGVSGRSAGGREVQERRGGSNEQLRLRLDLNLDVEVQLKAKIRGDLTLQLIGTRLGNGTQRHNLPPISRKGLVVKNVQHPQPNRVQRRSFLTGSIPSILIPPTIFIGLLLTLWTWKCFWIVMLQDKLLYLSWLPPLSRSEKIEDYKREFRGVAWSETSIRSEDGTRLAVCEGRLPSCASSVRKIGDGGIGAAKKKRKIKVVICYFQGNGGSTPLRLPLLSLVMKAIQESSSSSSVTDGTEHEYEYIITALSYRGYWKSSGRATQRGIEADAQAFLDWVHDSNTEEGHDLRIVLWGHSLGAAVASSALAKRLSTSTETEPTGVKRDNVAGLILEAPISSIKDMLIALYPQKWLPYRYLHPFSWNTWDVAGNLERLAQHHKSFSETGTANGGEVPPILLLSAENDEVIPLWVAEQLEAKGKDLGLDIERMNVQGAMHIEAPLKVEGRGKLVGFIRNCAEDIDGGKKT
ncbi:Alpha/Beta hydrolase protein [Aspergillus multicolor]|uniref:alpha/beta hydrolase n=1 Tax=Aspergillus multicolor TaxID=41759 RepID=UPI003CCE2A08